MQCKIQNPKARRSIPSPIVGPLYFHAYAYPASGLIGFFHVQTRYVAIVHLLELSPCRFSPDRRLSSERRWCLDESDLEPRDTMIG